MPPLPVPSLRRMELQVPPNPPELPQLLLGETEGWGQTSAPLGVRPSSHQHLPPRPHPSDLVNVGRGHFTLFN